MIKTGNIFFDFLSFLSVISPLLPAAAIFLKKNYRNDSLNFLMILCLLSFIRNLLLFIPGLNIASQNIIANIFELAEFILLIFIFKNLLSVKLRSQVNILFSVFLSIVITVYLLEGPQQKIFFFEELKNVILIFASIVCIARLTGSDSLDIFDEPLFWIATGSLFYFTIDVLIQSLSSNYEKASNHEISGNILLLNIGNIARYFFYLLASFFYADRNNEKKMFD
jgi:hypothetical protein